MYYENSTAPRSYELLAKAIEHQHEVYFWYKGNRRIVRPHAISDTNQGDALWAYQVAGESQSGSARALRTLKCFYVEYFENLRDSASKDRVLILPQKFAKNPFFKEGSVRGPVKALLPDCVKPDLVDCEIVLLDLSRDSTAARYNRKTHGETPIHATLSVSSPQQLESLVTILVHHFLCRDGQLRDLDGVEATKATIQNILENCIQFRFPSQIDKDCVDTFLVLSSGVF